MTPRFLAAGESALVVEFAQVISEAAQEAVMTLDGAIAARPIAGVIETVPTYRSLMVHFDPRVTDAARLRQAIEGLESGPLAAPTVKSWRIPVCYDPPHSEDLAEAAGILGLPSEQVAALHAEARFTVLMYGFAPGFIFLGGLPEALTKISRRLTPRPPTPPGALTIANGQALIASVSMPTGWYMLGRTPARTFDLGHDPIFPIGVGDHVLIERIDPSRFAELEAAAAAGHSCIKAVAP
jgi:KipI family sensor histidine kinase inhibitor